MLNKVVLPYTIWYTGLEKILRLNLDKKIDVVTNISTKATLNGTSVNDLVSAIFNPKTKSIDITIRSDARMDVDGEMEISLSYSDAKTHESILVVSVRSHENTATENPKEVKQTKLTLLNGQSHTVGAADEQVVYSFDLVNRNVTDEFATYGDVKDMLIGLGVTDSGEKDQYTIALEGDNLVLSKENDPSYRKIINLAKYHDEVSGEPLNVEDLKRDILSIVDGKLPDFEMLMNDILAEAVKKDAQLKVDILHEVDGKIPNGDTIKQEILADVNPRIPDKDTLKTEILESAGEKDAALKTAILEEVGTRTTQNNQSLKQEIMGEVDGKLPNTAVLKEDILGEVDTKITTNNQTLKSTVMSEVDSKIPDVSVVKSEILGEVNPKLLDKETLKQEILSAVPTPSNYTLTMEDDNLVLGKEGDTSYRKVINLAKYRDANTGGINDIYSFVHALELSTDSNRNHFANEVLYNFNLSVKVNDNKDIEIYNTPDYYDSNGEKVTTPYKVLTISHDILSSQNVDVEQIKKDILASITIPKADAIKEEILQALPTIPNYTLTLNENTLTLGKEGDSEFAKTIDLSKYVNGPAVDTEQLKRDIIAAIHVPDEATIKQNILAEVNPKLIDKDTFKQEILSALPAKDEYSLELTEDTLVLTKTNDSSYRKEINLAKYHDEVGQPINVEALKSDILSQVDTKISAIPKHNMTADEILNVLDNENDPEKFNNLANAIMIQFTSTDNHLRFHKTDSAYEIVLDGDGELLELSTPILTIPFSSLRELPTATQAEPVTIEKIFELLNDDSKANILNLIKTKLDIPEPTHPVKLISEPSVTNGVLKFNTETDAPTVDFTNDFYTKAKVDALLSNAAPSGPIEGHGRPDKKAELNDAKIGTTYVDLDRTDGAHIWMKKSKWVVIEGDTGEVDFDQTIFIHCKIRRVNDTVIITPNKRNESTFKRDIIEEIFNHNNSIKLSHYSKNGWEPLTETVVPFTWIYDSSQATTDTNWDIIPDQDNKYVSYTGRVIFDKGIDEGMDIKLEPDYGLFGKDSDNWILEMGLNDRIIMIYQQFIYQTDAVWPELSN